MSWFQGALLISFAIGPVVGGFVVAAFGARSPFLAQALLCLPALALLHPVFRAGRDHADLHAGLVAERGSAG